MRFIHTADFHLGKTLCQHSLLEDQSYILGEIKRVIKAEKPDAVIIAGDLYDRSVPPADAVSVLDDWLADVVLEMGVPVLAIAGNHDSASRLQFGSGMLQKAGYHMAALPSRGIGHVRLEDAAGPVDVFLLPYADPPYVRDYFLARAGDDETAREAAAEIREHDQAMKAWMAHLADLRGNEGMDSKRAVLVGHAFVQGGDVSDSERKLSVGGADQVPADHFAGLDYVALGHLHKPQQMLGGTVRYSGSPLKYSISEAEHQKCLLMVELDGDGQVEVTEIPLAARRDLSILEGTLDEIVEAGTAAKAEGRDEDYIHARVISDEVLHEPMRKIKTVWPHALSMERVLTRVAGDNTVGSGQENTISQRLAERPLDELFGDFHRQLLERDLGDDALTVVQTTVTDLNRHE